MVYLYWNLLMFYVCEESTEAEKAQAAYNKESLEADKATEVIMAFNCLPLLELVLILWLPIVYQAWKKEVHEADNAEDKEKTLASRARREHHTVRIMAFNCCIMAFTTTKLNGSLPSKCLSICLTIW